ncbi:efflux transporter outer membrane subunit [Pseudomonas sp. LRF_L74]|uniref:efflux transporter outer membrane subunit n=1 Tax=Pseudomonas sp. LRF_L74 TaxID=3369422 RepID=UPI003F5EE5DA
MTRTLPFVIAVLLIQGCSSPTATVELPAAPQQWRTASLGSAPVDGWWQAFASSELDQVVQQVLAQNQELAAAVARVNQAEATARQAGAPLLPSLTGNLEASREGRLGGDNDVDGDAFYAGLAASYEIDLWGRLRATRDSALASLNASAFDRDAMQISLAASAATSWLQYQGLSERLRIGRLNLSTAERVLNTVQARRNAGAATPLELAQQRGVVASQRRSVAELAQQLEDSRSTLAVLLGRNEVELRLDEISLARLTPPDIAAGVPSDLLLQRPDLAYAEANLAAANADLKAARAALLPSLTLSASAAGSSSRLPRLFSDPIYSLAGALVAPIFDGGYLAASRDLAEARREELLADYRQSIVSAFQDVQVALNTQAGIDAQLLAQLEVERQAEEAFRLAESRYRAGAETLLVLLDTQRTLYQAQDETAELRLSRLQASVSLARALGGGWQRQTQLAATPARGEG